MTEHDLGVDMFTPNPKAPPRNGELIVREAAPLPAPEGDDQSLLSVIARMASDPAVDVGKLERLMSLYERGQEREAERSFNEAMASAQEEMTPVRVDAENDHTHSKYATYAALDRAMRPIYTKHGFALSFDTGDGPEGTIRVLCYVAHKTGFKRTYKIDMPADGKGAKGNDVMTKTHATGSAISYGQRYLLKAIFNIAVASDDDGNGAGDTVSAITADQLQKIRDLIERSNSDIEAFCKWLKVEALPDIKQKDFDRAIEALNMKERKAKK